MGGLCTHNHTAVCHLAAATLVAPGALQFRYCCPTGPIHSCQRAVWLEGGHSEVCGSGEWAIPNAGVWFLPTSVCLSLRVSACRGITLRDMSTPCIQADVLDTVTQLLALMSLKFFNSTSHDKNWSKLLLCITLALVIWCGLKTHKLAKR